MALGDASHKLPIGVKFVTRKETALFQIRLRVMRVSRVSIPTCCNKWAASRMTPTCAGRVAIHTRITRTARK